MPRLGLFGRDVCLKLACCALWEETLQALSITQALRLASCTAGPSNRKVLQRRLGDGPLLDAAMARLKALVAATPVIPDVLASGIRSSTIIKDLENILDIDDGEAVLTAIVYAASDPAVLISGDKRFFTALREKRPQIWTSVADRLVSFERCLLAVIGTHGAAFVIERVRPVCSCDTTLMLAVGSSPECDAAAFAQALTSFDPLRDRA